MTLIVAQLMLRKIANRTTGQVDRGWTLIRMVEDLAYTKEINADDSAEIRFPSTRPLFLPPTANNLHHTPSQ